MTRCSRVLCAIVLGFAWAVSAAADWPTLHRDYQRSGYTAERLDGPLERKWYRSFVEEMIGARVEAVVAEGLCFVGTYAGNLHALRVEDGSTAWTLAAGGPVGHSPCYHDGRLYVSTDVGLDEPGSIVCIDARSGRLLWRYTAAAGFWTSPACDGAKVYAGDRAGVFHAVDAKTGRAAWDFATGYMILKPASLSPDGAKIVVGSEDMHVYCLSPKGKLLWKSAKLRGLSQRDQAPTVWRGKAVVRTNPAWGFHESLYAGRSLLRDIQARLPFDPAEDQAMADTKNYLWFVRTERRERAEYEGIVAFLKENPHLRTWFTFDLEDGREPWITSVLFKSGLHNPPTPPCFHPETGELYTLMPSALSVYCSGVSQTGLGVGRIDPETGYLTNLPHAYGTKEPGYFSGMPMITDETSTVGLMGDFLVVTHQGAVGGVDLLSRRIRQLHGRRDSYGGLFGPGAAPGSWDGSKQLAREGYVQNTVNEWHGPDRSMAAITGGRAFWVVGGCVVCFAGRDVPAAESGGADPPAPWRWSKMPRIDGGNLTGPFGSFDASLPKPTLTAAALEKYVGEPAAVEPAEDDLARRLREKLDAAVVDLIDGHPWAVFVVELGIAKEERHFWRASETMQAVALALPHLSPPVRQRAVAFLDKLYDDGAPLDRPVVGRDGRRREHYDLSPPLRASADSPPSYTATIADLYALWAYAHYAGRWDKVLDRVPAVREGFRQSLGRPFAFDPQAQRGGAVEQLNGQIAGVVAYVRIMRRAGEEDEARAAMDLLAQMAAARICFERAEGRLQTERAHHAKVPRYLDLVPELSRLLADHAGDALAKNLGDLDRELPVWYQAWAERLIGGENYVTPPHLARGMFAAMADGLRTEPARLVRYLDQPWCKADVYYIEKLSALLRRGTAAKPQAAVFRPSHLPI